MDKIITGNAIEVLKELLDCSADCCITSPPYLGLRDYGVSGQLGLENSVEAYINRLTDIFREVRRVLKNDGTLWLNIGDSYVSSNSEYSNCKRKDLIGAPWLLAFALRNDGWYLRQDIIWEKPNAMPESVKDRCTKSHEYIFLFSKQSKYYFDYEAIKEPAVGFNNIVPAGSKGTLRPNSRLRKGNSRTFRGGGVYTKGQSFNNSAEIMRESHGNNENMTGLRNKRSVWTVATQGYKEAHFATFPEKLIEPCVLAGSRDGGIILDPFIGSGTTAVVAKKHNRGFIGIELNPEYAEMARRRLEE
jgi:DNA (cytosine-5-)-methyltransferase